MSSGQVSRTDDESQLGEVCFLSILWEELIYNEDPSACGFYADDPDYLPVSHGEKFFYRCNSDVGMQLLQLFVKNVQPALCEQGLTKLDATFAMTLTHNMDANDVFVAEERLRAVSQRVYLRHHVWRVKEGVAISERGVDYYVPSVDPKPPIPEASIATEDLFDQAERWHLRIEPQQNVQLEFHCEETNPPVECNELSQTQRIILRALLELEATEEAKKVEAPAIAAKTKMTPDPRLRQELAILRKFRVLGGQLSSRGYWLTPAGVAFATSLP